MHLGVTSIKSSEWHLHDNRLEGDLDVEFARNTGDTPGVLLLVFVVERFDAHRLLRP